MRIGDEEPDASDKRICSSCVGEPFLKAAILTDGIDEQCSYCAADAKTISMGEMAERVATAFDQHFERTPAEPSSFEYAMMNDKESSYDWEREGEPVVWAIANAAVVDEKVATDIQSILKEINSGDPSDWSAEQDFDDDSYYQEKSPPDSILHRSPWQDEWHDFEKSLRTESRYFSEKTTEHLTKVFGRVEAMPTKGGNSLIVEAGPDKEMKAFFRARVCESWRALDPAIKEPDRQVGPPPPELARNGRMNAAGISVFYGASDSDTALAEVRPPVGAHVVVARFVLARPVRLLNIRAFADIAETGSVFDQGLAARVEHARFLRNLVSRITMPVMPSDETFAYLATQVVAEFLASRGPNLDGLLFPSAQTGGVNVVLFQKASRVAALDLPEGTTLYVDRGSFNGEEFEPELTVVEEIPPTKRKSKKKPAIAFDMFRDFTPPPLRDHRQVTLTVDLSAITVRTVKSASFTTIDEKVDRRRVKKVPPKKRRKGDRFPF